MRPALLSILSLLAAPALAAAARPAQVPAPTPASQQTKAEAGPVSVPLTISEEFLGRSGTKTAVRFTLSVRRGDLRLPPDRARFLSLILLADVKKADGTALEGFRVPMEVDTTDPDPARPLVGTFLQALPPGTLSLAFRLEGAAGKAIGTRAVTLVVPAMEKEFTAESAGPPTAASVLLEAANREAVPRDAGDLVKILAPSREVPVGLLRVECEVKPPVTRVEFWLDDKKLAARNRPPYTVEIDLGKIPRKQTLKALGFDAQGGFVDADAWGLGEREARLAVRILELPERGAAPATVDVKVAVQAVGEASTKVVRLFLDDRQVAEWKAPPYVARVPREELRRATLLRASAWDERDKEFADLKLLKGDARFVGSVEVNVVELNVSVLDAEGRFKKGLTKADFTVKEDEKPQELGTFEFAEALPLSVGLVIDGSGSMKDAMPLVHEAATGFVTRLFREKDQGFVVEFREAPKLLTPMTGKPADLVRAVRETQAAGGTALHDSLVMALYQFRATPGRKALVVLTDGKDNHSWTDWETLRRYVRSAGVPIYVIGLDLSIFDMGLKSRLSELASDTGAEAFFVGNAKGLDEIYRKIEAELRAQYFLTYLTTSTKPKEQYRTVSVTLREAGLKARTIRGFFP